MMCFPPVDTPKGSTVDFGEDVIIAYLFTDQGIAIGHTLSPNCLYLSSFNYSRAKRLNCVIVKFPAVLTIVPENFSIDRTLDPIFAHNILAGFLQRVSLYIFLINVGALLFDSLAYFPYENAVNLCVHIVSSS